MKISSFLGLCFFLGLFGQAFAVTVAQLKEYTEKVNRGETAIYEEAFSAACLGLGEIAFFGQFEVRNLFAALLEKDGLIREKAIDWAITQFEYLKPDVKEIGSVFKLVLGIDSIDLNLRKKLFNAMLKYYSDTLFKEKQEILAYACVLNNIVAYILPNNAIKFFDSNTIKLAFKDLSESNRKNLFIKINDIMDDNGLKKELLGALNDAAQVEDLSHSSSELNEFIKELTSAQTELVVEAKKKTEEAAEEKRIADEKRVAEEKRIKGERENKEATANQEKLQAGTKKEADEAQAKFVFDIWSNKVTSDNLKQYLKYGANINAQDSCHVTPLTQAIRKGFEPIVKLLLDNDADANMADNFSNCQNPPLILASKNSNLNIVKMLLSKGANVNAKDGLGKTALDYAKDQKIIDLLGGGSSTEKTELKTKLGALKDSLAMLKNKLSLLNGSLTQLKTNLKKSTVC
jgi:ankyrin repeat protein